MLLFLLLWPAPLCRLMQVRTPQNTAVTRLPTTDPFIIKGCLHVMPDNLGCSLTFACYLLLESRPCNATYLLSLLPLESKWDEDLIQARRAEGRKDSSLYKTAHKNTCGKYFSKFWEIMRFKSPSYPLPCSLICPNLLTMKNMPGVLAWRHLLKPEKTEQEVKSVSTVCQGNNQSSRQPGLS